MNTTDLTEEQKQELIKVITEGNKSLLIIFGEPTRPGVLEFSLCTRGDLQQLYLMAEATISRLKFVLFEKEMVDSCFQRVSPNGKTDT